MARFDVEVWETYREYVPKKEEPKQEEVGCFQMFFGAIFCVIFWALAIRGCTSFME